ncbi:MAG: imelysin [Flavobacteriaceae bacterium]|nr:MAG: imelysin [Flavobacteriaceae bacterium]
MKNYNSLAKIAFLTVLSIQLISCEDDDPTPVVAEISYSEHLKNITDNVIVETYTDLANKAGILLNEVTDFKANRTVSNYDEAKQAWRDSRAPWEQSEGFLFGPVDTDGVDPAIDAWPVNEVDLNNVLASSDVLNESYIESAIDEIKGFHTIEYLLWSVDGNKQLEDFTDREFDYLIAATENLKNRTQQLADAWTSSYANILKTAGNNSVFVSQKSALETLVAGLIAIADEVGTGKIEDPLNGNSGSADQTKEESRFSHNSKTDFSNNIKSISNIYNGTYFVDGKGLSDIIKVDNSDLDAEFNQALIDAIQAIDNIPGTFTTAIVSNRAQVTNAQNKVLAVLDLLESQIAPVIKKI